MRITSGTLLVAPPKMPDPRFSETVILVSGHTSRGSTGFILNQPTGETLAPVSRALNITPELHFEVSWGGPVTPDTLWLLHSPEWETDNTMYINNHWCVTSSTAMFHHAADGDMPRYFRWIAGSCAWAPGQLQAETQGQKPYTPSSSWITLSDVEPEWVWESDPDTLWEETLERASLDFVSRYL